MLELNVWCSWWWAYVPETCRAKNTFIKLSFCVKFAFQIILLFEIFIILRRFQRDMFVNVHRSSYETPVLFVSAQWISWNDFPLFCKCTWKSKWWYLGRSHPDDYFEGLRSPAWILNFLAQIFSYLFLGFHIYSGRVPQNRPQPLPIQFPIYTLTVWRLTTHIWVVPHS